MSGSKRTPKYAIRLVIALLSFAVVFFTGLQLFVPDGSRLTGSYDAASLLYIASAPVAYAGSQSCGNSSCHESIFNTWSEGAHGARQEQSKCEVCHGPQGKHPKDNKLPKVRGDGDLRELCLSCHRQMKARSSTGQPQVDPRQHPYPNDGKLVCTQCHNPHAPEMNKSKPATAADTSKPETKAGAQDPAAKLAEKCVGCHGPDGRGGFAPVLAGQTFNDLKEKLSKFKSGELAGNMMPPLAANMSAQDIETLALYFSSRP